MTENRILAVGLTMLAGSLVFAAVARGPDIGNGLLESPVPKQMPKDPGYVPPVRGKLDVIPPDSFDNPLPVAPMPREVKRPWVPLLILAPRSSAFGGVTVLPNVPCH